MTPSRLRLCFHPRLGRRQASIHERHLLKTNGLFRSTPVVAITSAGELLSTSGNRSTSLFTRLRLSKSPSAYAGRGPAPTSHGGRGIGYDRRVILDIRTGQEFARGHLDGAIHVPTPLPPLSDAALQRMHYTLRSITDGHPQNEPIFVYCKKGKRAAVAKQMLEQMGFRNVVNLGGVETPDLQTAIARGELAWSAA